VAPPFNANAVENRGTRCLSNAAADAQASISGENENLFVTRVFRVRACEWRHYFRRFLAASSARIIL